MSNEPLRIKNRELRNVPLVRDEPSGPEMPVPNSQFQILNPQSGSCHERSQIQL